MCHYGCTTKSKWDKLSCHFDALNKKYNTFFQKNIDKLRQNIHSRFSCEAMRIFPQKSHFSDAKSVSRSAAITFMDFPLTLAHLFLL